MAEPGTITGSIGVLTGKVSFGKSLGLIGVSADEIGVGKNALFDSAIAPYTPDQLAALNEQADVIYADFKQKVSAGRKLPLAKVQDIAKGRVWSGADARKQGLVDALGGFWTAVAEVKKVAKIPADSRVLFKLSAPAWLLRSAGRTLRRFRSQRARGAGHGDALANTPLARAHDDEAHGLDTPRGGVEIAARRICRRPNRGRSRLGPSARAPLYRGARG